MANSTDFREAKSKKILLVDDQKVFRTAFLRLLSLIIEPPFDFVEAENGLEALRVMNDGKFDLIFLDVSMPVMNGYDACRKILSLDPRQPVIILTRHNESDVAAYFVSLGVSFITKDASFEEIRDAINAATNGRQYLQALHKTSVHSFLGSKKFELSMQEKKLIQLLQNGHSSKEIAETLNLTTKTVHTYRERLMKKTETKNVAQLISFTLKTGLVE